MKLATLVAWLWATAAAVAGQRTFAWDAVADPRLGTYRLYHGPEKHIYTNAVTLRGTNAAHRTQATITLPWGTNYVVATALTTNGLESDFSNEVVVDVRAVLTLLHAGDPRGPWLGLTNWSFQAGGVGFYRIQLDTMELKVQSAGATGGPWKELHRRPAQNGFYRLGLKL